METNHSGYVSTPHYLNGGYLVVPARQELNIGHVIHVPSGHVIMVSIRAYRCRETQFPYLNLLVSNPQGGEETGEIFTGRYNGTLWSTFLPQSPSHYIHHVVDKKKTLVFNTSAVAVVAFVQAGLFSRPQILAFQLYYSFHSEDRVPYKTGSDMYDCSVEYFPMFRKPLDCNSVAECAGWRVDEGDHCVACHFTHPADSGPCPFCPGGVTSPRNGKCYSFENMPNMHEETDFNEFLPLA
jgi:hypothetical protein